MEDWYNVVEEFIFVASQCTHMFSLSKLHVLHICLYHTSMKYCNLIGPLQVVYFTYTPVDAYTRIRTRTRLVHCRWFISLTHELDALALRAQDV